MSIALSIGNNLTTGGVFTADAVNNTSVTNVTDFASVPAGGALKLLSTQTASASATIDFTSGIDSTYDSYVFKFINIHPQNDAAIFLFQGDTGTNTNYNQTITSTNFYARHDQTGAVGQISYDSGSDQAQGTAFQRIGTEIGNGNSENASGYLQIFNPSSSIFVKHFLGDIQNFESNGYSFRVFSAGYFNTTTALTRFQFKMSSGNIDSGTIKLYGIKDS